MEHSQIPSTNSSGDQAEPTQLDANIGFYAEVYQKCLNKARSMSGTGSEARDVECVADEQRLMADTLFNRYFDDQLKMAGQSNAKNASQTLLETALPAIRSLMGGR